MARVFVNDTTLTDIADAIREKNGTEEMYKPSQMANVIRALAVGGASSMDGVSISEIVMETSTANTKQASDYIETFVNPNVTTVFVYKKYTDGTDLKTFTKNQALLICRMPYLIYSASLRYRDGVTSANWNNADYDFVINVGDEFYMIEFE